MVKVKYIEFLWSESGMYARSVFPKKCKCWGEANYFLVHIALHKEGKGGYDKTAFRIMWEDGEEYQGRYDIHSYQERQENTNGLVDLGDHIRDHLTFYAGLRCPHHMTPERYEAYLTSCGMTTAKRQAYVDFLATHSLSDF